MVHHAGFHSQQLAVDVSRVVGIVCSAHLVASQGFQLLVRLGISEVSQFLVMVPPHRLGLLQGISYRLRGSAITNLYRIDNLFVVLKGPHRQLLLQLKK